MQQKNIDHGRLTACRGTAAEMAPDTLQAWEKVHRQYMQTVPASFKIPH